MTLYHCEGPAGPACAEDIHGYFELTYASYLVLPRSLLQEMPAEWQHQFVRLLDEMSDRYRAPLDGEYMVQTRDAGGRFIKDPLRDYRHPDREAISRSAALVLTLMADWP